MDVDSIGARIRACREQMDMTQEQTLTVLRERTGAAVARETLSKWENDRQRPSAAALGDLAQVFGVSADYLIFGRVISGESEEEDFESLGFLPIHTRRIPLLGQIACGEPSFAEPEFDSYVLTGSAVGADFALRAKGESMIGARIYDGDLVFVRRQFDVRDGEIAVVMIDDEATLKRVYKFSDGTCELRAENPKYPPLRIGGANETRSVRVIGKAVAFQADVV
jgi:repressor LexA